MARLGNIQNYEERKKQEQATAPAVLHNDLSVIKNAAAATPETKPVLKPMDVDKIRESQRNNHMQSFGTWAEAAKDGRYSQQEWANAKIQDMVARGENPGDYYNLLSIYGEAESPEEKAKRERREALGETFRGLGNLIGNAANLYYTSKGAAPIDLNTANEKHRARMEQIKAKQEAIDEQRKQMLANAMLSDNKTARAEAAAKAKAKNDADAETLKFKRDVALKQIDNALKLGQIDAQAAADMKRDVARAKSAEQLESIKHKNDVALKQTPSGEESIRTSFALPNGDVYTRSTDLDDLEIMELARYMKDVTPYITKDINGEVYTDYKRAALDAVRSGSVPAEVLERMGYKKSGDSSRSEGFSFAQQNNGFSFKQ